MIKVFKIKHTLKEKLYNGTLVDFDKYRSEHISEVVADDSDSAIKKLKEIFNMLHCDILETPTMYEITEQEYETR